METRTWRILGLPWWLALMIAAGIYLFWKPILKLIDQVLAKFKATKSPALTIVPQEPKGTTDEIS